MQRDLSALYTPSPLVAFLMVLMEVSGVYTSSKSAYPQVVLKEKAGNAYLPIVIGRFEAAAISMAQKDRKPARPISYDLAQTILNTLDARLEKVAVTSLHEGTYFAEIHLRTAEGQSAILDSRPSDAIALALRLGAPIFASPKVLKEAGYVRSEGTEDAVPIASNAIFSQAEESTSRKPIGPQKPVNPQPETPEPAADNPVDCLERLKKRLERAVAEEAYEEAARLRDEIHLLEAEACAENTKQSDENVSDPGP